VTFRREATMRRLLADRDGCRYLGASKSAISLKDAKAKGYTGKVRHPPE
jgi:hypothetical protein